MVFSLGLAVMTLTATNLSAQDGGGLFGRGETDAGNRAGESFLLSNQQLGEGFGITNEQLGNGFGITNQQLGSTPIGSGLLLLVGAGLGYAALKKKKEN